MLDVSSASFAIRTPDVDRTRDWDASALGLPPGVERIPVVIAFCDVEDPFGNVLSLYEELGEG